MLECHIIYLLFTICICGYKVRLFSTYLDNNLIQYYISKSYKQSRRFISVINRLSRFITNLYHICGGFLTYFVIFKIF